jgi:hypothetical protein
MGRGSSKNPPEKFQQAPSTKRPNNNNNNNNKLFQKGAYIFILKSIR